MSSEDAKAFVRRHFEDFVKRPDLSAADRNFAADYQEHGTGVPPGLPAGPNGPKQSLAAAFKRFPGIHAAIEDIIAEGDRFAVRNTWRATDLEARQTQFGGIVIWRIVEAERWA